MAPREISWSKDRQVPDSVEIWLGLHLIFSGVSNSIKYFKWHTWAHSVIFVLTGLWSYSLLTVECMYSKSFPEMRNFVLWLVPLRALKRLSYWNASGRHKFTKLFFFWYFKFLFVLSLHACFSTVSKVSHNLSVTLFFSLHWLCLFKTLD